jgi:hypothetical protein
MKNFFCLLGSFIIGIVFTATGNNVFKGGFNGKNFLILSAFVLAWVFAWGFITSNTKKDVKGK